MSAFFVPFAIAFTFMVKPLVPAFADKLISLPISPLHFAVSVSVCADTVAETGNAVALITSTHFCATCSAVCPADTATLTCTPPIISVSAEAVCTVPLMFKLPVAATPALWLGKPITVKSKYALLLNACLTINCAHEPRPNKSPASASLNSCTGVKAA